MLPTAQRRLVADSPDQNDHRADDPDRGRHQGQDRADKTQQRAYGAQAQRHENDDRRDGQAPFYGTHIVGSPFWPHAP